MNKVLILCLLLCGPVMVFSQAVDRPAERKAYITGTFLTGFGINPGFGVDMNVNIGTCIEWINGGTVSWYALDDDSTKDMTVSWPLMFDVKLISRFGFGLTFGDLLTISMNYAYYDNNHLYFGLSYVYPLKRWDLGASLIVFPVYIVGDELIAGKIDTTYWFNKHIGITLTTVFGGTTDLVVWADTQVFLFTALIGVSVKI
jgi:hypothetical protein